MIVYTLYNLKLCKKKELKYETQVSFFLTKYIYSKIEKLQYYEIEFKFRNDENFRKVVIRELVKCMENEAHIQCCKELYIKLNGLKYAQKKLLSKNTLDIYRGLVEIDLFNILPQKSVVIRLINHPDKRISVLASCILFKYKNIEVTDLLNIESILCPIVEIKLFNEFKKQNISLNKHIRIIDVIKICLNRNISIKMRSFLTRSLILLNEQTNSVLT